MSQKGLKPVWENLAMIGDTIEYLRSSGRRVIYDAEHWFDGYKHNPDYAIKTLEAATLAGAECSSATPTVAPYTISQPVRDVVGQLPCNQWVFILIMIPIQRLPMP